MSWILPQQVGVTRADGLVLSSRIVNGAEPADWELWNGVESDGAATLATGRWATAEYAKGLQALTDKRSFNF